MTSLNRLRDASALGQIGTDLDHSFFAQNTYVNQANYGHYNAYESSATPGMRTHANPWATAHLGYHNGPFVDSNSLPLTSHAFAIDAAYNDGIALSTVPYAGTWGRYPDFRNSTPLINSNLSLLTDSTFAAGAVHNGAPAFPTASDPYTWEAAAGPGPMHNHIDASFPYADFPTPLMNSSAAATNGNSYSQSPLPATGFNTQSGAISEPPTTFHAIDNDNDISKGATARPTCTHCARSFSRHADLDRHAKKHKPDSKTFRCRVAGCAYSSYRNDKLIEHDRRRHQGVVGAALTQI